MGGGIKAVSLFVLSNSRVIILTDLSFLWLFETGYHIAQPGLELLM